MTDTQAKSDSTASAIITGSVRWLGIFAAAVAMLMGATGMLLSYSFEMNDALISSAEAPTDLDAISARMNALEAQGGDAKVNWIWSTAGRQGRFLLQYANAEGEGRMARLGGDGAILMDTGEKEFTFFEKVRDIHLALTAGKTGEWILTIVGLILLANLALAFFRALPRDGKWSGALKPSASGSSDQRLQSWYRSLSLWGAIPAFIVVLAAVVVYFEHSIEGPIGAPPIKLDANPPRGEFISFAAAARTAEAAIPGSRFVGGPMATQEDASYKFWVNQPGEF